MKAFTLLGAAIPLMLVGTVANAQSTNVDMTLIGQQLGQYSRELQALETTFRALARSSVPEGLDSTQLSRLKAERRALIATANEVRELSAQLGARARKASRGTLTRTDMESLRIEIRPVAVLGGSRNQVRAPDLGSIDRSALSDAIRDVQVRQDTVRNRRQKSETSFRSFDQQSNQLYMQLSSVLKTLNDTRMSTVRNML